MFDREEMRSSVTEFLEVYAGRPLVTNQGGMGINHSWATWYVLRLLHPALVVESGIFRGHSTWLIEQAVPAAEIYSFDINLGLRTYVSERARYFEMDVTRFDWSSVDTGDAVCFLDDHQNAYRRLIDMAWFGFRRAIIEDNWPVGEGDNYSMKHLMAGTGAPSLQMSAAYAGGWLARRARRRAERRLWGLGSRQDLLVGANDVDRANLGRRLKVYEELPPLRIPSQTMWNTDWTGAYACAEPLLQEMDFGDVDLSYSYLAYVELLD